MPQPFKPFENFQDEGKLIIYTTLVSNEDWCVMIVGRWDTSLDIVWKHHVSCNTTSKYLTKSHCLVIKRPSSVTFAQTPRSNRETDAAGRYKVSGEG